MVPNPVAFLAGWLFGRLRLIVTKAPRETPLGLILVLLVGILILLAYAMVQDIGAVIGLSL